MDSPGNTRVARRGLDLLAHFVEEVLPAAMLAAMVLMVFVAVFTRYLFNAPIPWVGEAAAALMIWQVMLAAAAAARKREHIRINLLGARLHGRTSHIYELIVCVVTSLVLFTVVVIGWQFAAHAADRYLQLIGISYQWLDAAVPVGCALIALHYCAQGWAAAKAIPTKAAPTAAKDPS